MTQIQKRTSSPSPLMGEGWDEGDKRELLPLNRALATNQLAPELGQALLNSSKSALLLIGEKMCNMSSELRT